MHPIGVDRRLKSQAWNDTLRSVVWAYVLRSLAWIHTPSLPAFLPCGLYDVCTMLQLEAYLEIRSYFCHVYCLHRIATRRISGNTIASAQNCSPLDWICTPGLLAWVCAPGSLAWIYAPVAPVGLDLRRRVAGLGLRAQVTGPGSIRSLAWIYTSTCWPGSTRPLARICASNCWPGSTRSLRCFGSIHVGHWPESTQPLCTELQPATLDLHAWVVGLSMHAWVPGLDLCPGVDLRALVAGLGRRTQVPGLDLRARWPGSATQIAGLDLHAHVAALGLHTQVSGLNLRGLWPRSTHQTTGCIPATCSMRYLHHVGASSISGTHDHVSATHSIRTFLQPETYR